MDQGKFILPANPGDKKLPIFFLQMGNEPGLFLKKILKQAQISNGSENVYLLTNANFSLYKEFNCIDVSKYTGGTALFDSLYQHHSTNTYLFEKICFDRWFIINALIKDLNIENFFYADCDVLILEDLRPIQAHILENNYDGSTMYFEHEGNSITCAHSSFWNTKLLDDFCNFVCKKYADQGEFNKLLNDTLAGKFLDNLNVSDMILLDLFRTETRPNVLNLLSLEESGIAFDFNANVSYNGWKHSFVRSSFFKIKRLDKRGDGWYGQIGGDKESKIKFYTLHFQGYLTKSLIPFYTTTTTNIARLWNYLLAVFTFLVRRALLFKTHIKDETKRHLQKAK